MATLTDLNSLVQEFADRLESLQLDGDEQEEYSTMLCRLEDQADRSDPNYAIVVECVNYLSRYRATSKPNAA